MLNRMASVLASALTWFQLIVWHVHTTHAVPGTTHDPQQQQKARPTSLIVMSSFIGAKH